MLSQQCCACGTDTANYGPKAPTQWTSRSGATPEIAEIANALSLSPSTRRRKLPAWIYGENLDSSPWTPVCTLKSVLTNTSQLAQRTPGQLGIHSTGCVHRLAGLESTCQSGVFKRPRNVWSGTPSCNIYRSAPMMDTACSPTTRQQLMPSPSAVPGIGGGARFDWRTTHCGRIRIMMTVKCSNQFSVIYKPNILLVWWACR